MLTIADDVWVNDCGYLRRRTPWDVPTSASLRFTPPARPETASAAADIPVTPFAIAGRYPSDWQLQAVRDELSKAPRPVLNEWRARGGRVEVVAGGNAGIHPAWPHGKCLGFCCSPLVVIAGDFPRLTALHEAGHAHDDVRLRGGRFSGTPAWQRIHKGLKEANFNEESGGLSKHVLSDPAETFAELFAACIAAMRVTSPRRPATLSQQPPARPRRTSLQNFCDTN